MLYDLGNILDRERFKRRCNALYAKGAVAELTEKQNRTRRQNSYLHLIIGYFSLETGNRADYVKQEYFKRLCNRDIFCVEVEDRYMGRVETLRSSADLTTEEMSTAIERFRHWSSQEAGIYLPSANEQQFLDSIELEIERSRRYL